MLGLQHLFHGLPAVSKSNIYTKKTTFRTLDVDIDVDIFLGLLWQHTTNSTFTSHFIGYTLLEPG